MPATGIVRVCRCRQGRQRTKASTIWPIDGATREASNLEAHAAAASSGRADIAADVCGRQLS